MLQNLNVFADGVWPRDFAVAFFRSPDEGAAAATPRHRLLTHQLRRTGSRRDWRRTAEELDETPQVLRSCCEQHLVLCSVQAAQPKSIELFKMRFMWADRTRSSCVRGAIVGTPPC